MNFDYSSEVDFVDYTSDFTSEIDLDFMPEDHTYSEEWVLTPEMESSILDYAEAWAKKFGYNIEQLISKAKLLGVINAIVSVTGDDEIITTNNVLLGFIHLGVSECISKILIAVKDTNVSNRKGNYTEGWILLAPANEADFTSVVLRHKGDGIPLVFDITKLKATSAVRKQSKLEVDLESKYALLNKAAQWVDEDWFTYDFAQMSLVFATCIFDFNDTRIFPFLYKSEGGCGGKPPWNNIGTAECALAYFNKGKAFRSVLALMDECSSISDFTKKPKDAIYVNASHYAQAGNEALGKISNAKRYLSSIRPEDRLEVLEQCRGVDPLPMELLEKSYTVEVEDKLLGAAISEMRKNNLVMTELDVRLKEIGMMKFVDLLGDENMGSIRLKREKEKEIAKRNGYAQLAKFAESDRTLEGIENNAMSIFARYYTLRSDISDITSLVYAGVLRLFKTTDVENHYRRNGFGLVDEIIEGVSSARRQNLNLKLNEARTDYEYQLDWMESGELSDLFDGEIPPSLGSDDARIARKIRATLSTMEKLPLVAVVITNDTEMIKSLKTLFKTDNITICQYNVQSYVKACHENIVISRAEAYNFLRGRTTKFPEIERMIRLSCSWRRRTRVGYKVLYDFPNLNRSLMGMFMKNRKTLGKRGGGFLRRKTAKTQQYQLLEWESFKKLRDFDRTVVYYDLG